MKQARGGSVAERLDHRRRIPLARIPCNSVLPNGWPLSCLGCAPPARETPEPFDARRLPSQGKPRAQGQLQPFVRRRGAATLVVVSRATEKLLEDALRLDLPERAELAVELLASLDGAPDPDAQAAWAAEIERRARRAYSGDDPGRAWAQVRDDVRDELRRR